MELKVVLSEEDRSCEWYQDNFGIIQPKQDKTKEEFCRLIGQSLLAMKEGEPSKLVRFNLADIFLTKVSQPDKNGNTTITLNVGGCFSNGN